MERPDAGVSAPAEDQFVRSTHADELVVYHIWCHANQRKITSTLPDDLVPCLERDEVGEPFHRDHVLIVDQVGNRVVERGKLCHDRYALSGCGLVAVRGSARLDGHEKRLCARASDPLVACERSAR